MGVEQKIEVIHNYEDKEIINIYLRSGWRVSNMVATEKYAYVLLEKQDEVNYSMSTHHEFPKITIS